MRNLILKMSASVDGFVGGPNGELDWIFRSLDKDATAWTMENLWRAGVHHRPTPRGLKTISGTPGFWLGGPEPWLLCSQSCTR